MTDTIVQDVDVDRLAERYVHFWNTGAEEKQQRLADAAFRPDVEYRAPIGILTGAPALMDFRRQFIGHLGSAEFRLREQPQAHHGRARLCWEILTGDGASFATGTDVIALDEDGRIASVTVFLDRAPEGFGAQPHD
ncbi:nuclear transport factor 2 family protein [Streptomyces sp. NPDC046275]|uniref:nuclear transport factor 2 family protein n=1 Tax=Streptomyces sp. NPDC046275 TaxID=3157201 RepID=UPI0034100D23